MTQDNDIVVWIAFITWSQFNPLNLMYYIVVLYLDIVREEFEMKRGNVSIPCSQKKGSLT